VGGGIHVGSAPMRLFGWVYLAVFCALGTFVMYLSVLDSTAATAWSRVLLAVVVLAVTVLGAKGAAWSHRRTASREPTRMPWWWFLLLSAVIMSGPYLGRLGTSVPVFTVLYLLGGALLLGLAFFLIGHEWRSRQRRAEPEKSH
jgi:drug/metabolite transporter (DMT)-like permease